MTSERSLVIPSHGRASLTCALLESLIEQGLERTEVLLVQDGPPENGASPLSAFESESIRLISTDRRGGYGRACNAGAREARGRHLVFLNNDMLPTPGWLDALEAVADGSGSPKIAGARLLYPDNTLQHGGVVFDSEALPRHVYAGFPADHPAVTRERRFQAVTGAAMLVERDLFHSLGGFDEGFVNGFEDVDFCLRAGALGAEVHYCPEAVLYHVEGATRGSAIGDDVANWDLFRARWADRLRRDDVAIYAEDGLLRVNYEDDGTLRVRVAPDLGVALGSEHGRVEQLLAGHVRRSLALRAENSRLVLAPEQRPVRWRATVPRRATSELTVSVVSAVGDHDSHESYVAALAAQTLPPERYEVLLVDYRDDAEGEEAIQRALGGVSSRANMQYLASPPETGRAGSFNRGIRSAGGDLVLLLADDFVPVESLVEQHIASHEADPRDWAGALGPAFFPEPLRTDPFVRWAEDTGHLFGVPFPFMEDTLRLDFFYCANTSLKRSFLLGDDLFDERLFLDAWDDHELGLRLFDRGLEMHYLPGAKAWHDHLLTLEERTATMRDAGCSAAIFDRIYPAPHRWTSGVDPSESLLELRLRAAMTLARQRLRGGVDDLYARYEAVLRHAFLEGYREVAWNGVTTPTPARRPAIN